MSSLPERQVMTLLANRILLAGESIDHARDSHPLFSPDEFKDCASTIEVNLAIIAELERVWICLFDGEAPSIAEVYRAASQ